MFVKSSRAPRSALAHLQRQILRGLWRVVRTLLMGFVALGPAPPPPPPPPPPPICEPAPATNLVKKR